VWFAVLSLVIGFPLPVLLAAWMTELRRSRATATVVAYLPAVVPPTVAVLLWKQFFRPDESGLFNTILGAVGIPPQPWLQDAAAAMPSIVVQATWAGFGSTAIIYLAALLSIRPELYDAAETDGAGIVRRFWHITLPQLRTVILLMLLLQIIGTLQVFTEPYLMTGGGPNNATVTVLMLIYRYAFINGDFGGATALSVMLFLVLSVFSLIYLRLTRGWSAAS
jgi:multiple sugar transport system permease protein